MNASSSNKEKNDKNNDKNNEKSKEKMNDKHKKSSRKPPLIVLIALLHEIDRFKMMEEEMPQGRVCVCEWV